MRFLRSIKTKTNAKGRVFLPATFRKVLQVAGEESLVLRRNVLQPCLTPYPESVWNAQLDTLRRHLSRWNTQKQFIFRQFVSDAKLLSLDVDERLLIPERYLKVVSTEQATKFIGMDGTIETWYNDVIEKSFIQPEGFGKALQEITNKGTEPTKETE